MRYWQGIKNGPAKEIRSRATGSSTLALPRANLRISSDAPTRSACGQFISDELFFWIKAKKSRRGPRHLATLIG